MRLLTDGLSPQFLLNKKSMFLIDATYIEKEAKGYDENSVNRVRLPKAESTGSELFQCSAVLHHGVLAGKSLGCWVISSDVRTSFDYRQTVSLAGGSNP